MDLPTFNSYAEDSGQLADKQGRLSGDIWLMIKERSHCHPSEFSMAKLCDYNNAWHKLQFAIWRPSGRHKRPSGRQRRPWGGPCGAILFTFNVLTIEADFSKHCRRHTVTVTRHWADRAADDDSRHSCTGGCGEPVHCGPSRHDCFKTKLYTAAYR